VRDAAIVASAVGAGISAAVGPLPAAALLAMLAVLLTLKGQRPIPFPLTALIAVFSAFAALALANHHDLHGQRQPEPAAPKAHHH
jgi:hypothetical protein